jgi:hypothetical protein
MWTIVRPLRGLTKALSRLEIGIFVYGTLSTVHGDLLLARTMFIGLVCQKSMTEKGHSGRLQYRRVYVQFGTFDTQI